MHRATFIRCRLDEVDEPVLHAVNKIFGNQQEPYTELVIRAQQERDRRPRNKEYRRRYQRKDYPFLAQVIAGEVPGRERDTETIYFDNNSAGLQFAATGRVVYDRAKQLGLGMHIPVE